jgi:predicted transcriptional regulator
MATKFKDLKHKASPERMEREGREALAEFEEMESIRMGFLRASRKTTQVELAEQMQVPQSSISRLEKQNDCHLSTLRKYVTALGGRLEMRAVFPDKIIELDSLMMEGNSR